MSKPPYAINRPSAFQHQGGKRTHEQFVLEFSKLWGDVYCLARGEEYESWNKKMKIWDSLNDEYFYRNANGILQGEGNRGLKRGQARERQLERESQLLVI